VFASSVEEDVGLLNKAAPQSGKFYQLLERLYQQM
jgi:hypothetical protein